MERRRAFSLIELLMAVVILAAVLGSLFTGMHTGYQGTERLVEESYASNHAISLMEAMVVVPYGKLPEIAAGTPDMDVPVLMAAVPEFAYGGASDPAFPRTVEVTEICRRARDPSDPDNSRWGALKRIRIEVTWKARYLKPALPKTLVFETLVTDDTEVSR